jgi:hypothetical protein
MRKEHWKMLPKLVRPLRGGRNGVYLGNLIQAILGMPPSEGGAGLTLRRVGVYEGWRVERADVEIDQVVKGMGVECEKEAKSVVVKSDW